MGLFSNKAERDQGNDIHVTQMASIAAKVSRDLNSVNDIELILNTINNLNIITRWLIQQNINEYKLLTLDNGKTPVLRLNQFHTLTIDFI